MEGVAELGQVRGADQISGLRAAWPSVGSSSEHSSAMTLTTTSSSIREKAGDVVLFSGIGVADVRFCRGQGGSLAADVGHGGPALHWNAGGGPTLH
jgi:hypothetical protein